MKNLKTESFTKVILTATTSHLHHFLTSQRQNLRVITPYLFCYHLSIHDGSSITDLVFSVMLLLHSCKYPFCPMLNRICVHNILVFFGVSRMFDSLHIVVNELGIEVLGWPLQRVTNHSFFDFREHSGPVKVIRRLFDQQSRQTGVTALGIDFHQSKDSFLKR